MCFDIVSYKHCDILKEVYDKEKDIFDNLFALWEFKSFHLNKNNV